VSPDPETTGALAAAVLEALRAVKDPELDRGLVEAGMVPGIEDAGGAVTVAVRLTSPACPRRADLEAAVKRAAGAVDGVKSVAVRFSSAVAYRADLPVPNAARLGSIRNVVAVASGKGGVGKSTVAANLALALRDEGARVALMDADIYGPSQPLMFGIQGRQPEIRGDRLLPFEAHGIRLMSMGLLIEEGKSVVWRGPMIHKALAQFFEDVLWGEVDYLVVDLPPGTGDAQLSLSQLVPMTGAVVVTTPQEMSLIDVRKAADMFRKVRVPILGVIENMSTFVCPCCRTETAIFDRGGGERAAREWGVPFLGGIPIDPAVRAAGDAGVPVVAAHPESETAEAFRRVARAVACRVSVEVLTGAAPEPPAVAANPRGGFEV
jgi:ATP-binding protein involved in chromosome partitioning